MMGMKSSEMNGRRYALSADSVLGIQMCLLGVCYEKLGLVRVRAGVGHRDDASGVELERRVK